MNPATLDTLLKTQPAVWRGRDRYSVESSIPTGFAALDNALPAHGWGIGGVTELLLEQHGIGELSLLLPALRYVVGGANSTASQLSAGSHNTGWAALVNPPYIPYAPALGNAGIALDRLLIINSGDDINTLWSTEQLLRSGLFGAVVAWVHKSSAQRQRRLQLAAESGGSWAAVYRPLHAQQEHSPVSTRICVTMEMAPGAPVDAAPISTGAASTAAASTGAAHRQQLTLDIIKVRAGNPQTVTIEPEEFDASQGAEWPVPQSMSSLRGIKKSVSTAAVSTRGVSTGATPSRLRSLSDR